MKIKDHKNSLFFIIRVKKALKLKSKGFTSFWILLLFLVLGLVLLNTPVWSKIQKTPPSNSAKSVFPEIYGKIVVLEASIAEDLDRAKRALGYLEIPQREANLAQFKNLSAEFQKTSQKRQQLEQHLINAIHNKASEKGNLKSKQEHFWNPEILQKVHNQLDNIHKELQNLQKQLQASLAKFKTSLLPDLPQDPKKLARDPFQGKMPIGAVHFFPFFSEGRPLTEGEFYPALAPLNLDFLVPCEYLKMANSYKSLNNFDFSYFDKVVNLNAKYGYKTGIWLLESQIRPSKSLLEALGDEVLMHDENGQVVREGKSWQANIFHPKVQEIVYNFVKAVGEYYRANPNILFYEIYNEPITMHAIDSGRDKAGFQLFQNYLKNKYKSIDQINKRFGTDLSDLSKMSIPSLSTTLSTHKITPLSYEFETCLQQGFADFLKECVQTLHAADPKRPVMSQMVGFQDQKDKHRINNYQIAKASDWDYFSMHDGVFSNPAQGEFFNTDVDYTYWISHYADKMLFNEEYWWILPESKGKGEIAQENLDQEDLLIAAAKRNFWVQLLYGKRGFIFFELDNFWPGWNDYMLNKKYHYRLLRPSAGIIPTLKERALRFQSVLGSSEVRGEEVALYDPNSSRLLLGSPEFIKQTMTFTHTLLVQQTVLSSFLPEDAVKEGKAQFKDFKLVILPAAVYLPYDISTQLIEYVRAGGKVLCLGLAGVFDPSGKEDGHLMREIFGIDKTSWETGFAKDLVITRTKDFAQPLEGFSVYKGAEALPMAVSKVDSSKSVILGVLADKYPSIIKAKFGKGEAILFSHPCGSKEQIKNTLANVVASAINQLIPPEQRQVQVTGAHPLVVWRNDDQGHQILGIVNFEAQSEIKVKVELKGNYKQIVDLDAFNQIVPIESKSQSCCFELNLGPGQGTLLALQPTPIDNDSKNTLN